MLPAIPAAWERMQNPEIKVLLKAMCEIWHLDQPFVSLELMLWQWHSPSSALSWLSPLSSRSETKYMWIRHPNMHNTQSSSFDLCVLNPVYICKSINFLDVVHSLLNSGKCKIHACFLLAAVVLPVLFFIFSQRDAKESISFACIRRE